MHRRFLAQGRQELVRVAVAVERGVLEIGCRASRAAGTEFRYIEEAVTALEWLSGAEVDWTRWWPGARRPRRVPLFAYPFDRRVCLPKDAGPVPPGHPPHPAVPAVEPVGGNR
ncbi:hypothetical protein L6E12_15320 [Actinokineospora sp. PR83]|uniref:hypothetical protein n=1 Tax=Actinokineospora sp. PR83 TaxID=2884908 RepID=UPI001F27980E|nr:hypothetical protein [Actinokineospora sp. PR83]MCG8917156.1 hypothetical protein [Actinokineospora sp. PR83]